MLILQNTDFYFFRKPHGVASTFGKEKSFLDYLFIDQIDLPNNSVSYNDLNKPLLKHIDKQIQNLNISTMQGQETQQKIISQLTNNFGENKEYGLLNRLDNDTGGLLYFAKNPEIYDNYKIQQKQDLIKKFYIAQVRGNPFFKTDNSEMIVDYPIMHHKFSEDRMIYISKPGDITRGNGKQHLASTKISLLDFDSAQNISTLLICISKGIRHQIRVHLSSIGCPIIGENIYSNNKSEDFLHLWSVGFK